MVTFLTPPEGTTTLQFYGETLVCPPGTWAEFADVCDLPEYWPAATLSKDIARGMILDGRLMPVAVDGVVCGFVATEVVQRWSYTGMVNP